jgi:hypothetical protein
MQVVRGGARGGDREVGDACGAAVDAAGSKRGVFPPTLLTGRSRQCRSPGALAPRRSPGANSASLSALGRSASRRWPCRRWLRPRLHHALEMGSELLDITDLAIVAVDVGASTGRVFSDLRRGAISRQQLLRATRATASRREREGRVLAGCPRATHAGCPRATHAGCPRATHAGCPRATHAGCPRATHPQRLRGPLLSKLTRNCPGARPRAEHRRSVRACQWVHRAIRRGEFPR